MHFCFYKARNNGRTLLVVVMSPNPTGKEEQGKEKTEFVFACIGLWELRSIHSLIDWFICSLNHSFVHSLAKAPDGYICQWQSYFPRYRCCDDHGVISGVDLLQCNPGMDYKIFHAGRLPSCLEHRQVPRAERSKYEQRKHCLSQQGLLRVMRQIFLRIFTYNCIWIKFYFFYLFLLRFIRSFANLYFVLYLLFIYLFIVVTTCFQSKNPNASIMLAI